MTYDEFNNNMEIEQTCTGSCYETKVPKYDWMYNNSYWYWLGTPYTNSSSGVYTVANNGLYTEIEVFEKNIFGNYGVAVVRPVIVLSKSALSS